MTEQEWLECTEPYPILAFLKDNADNRRLILYGSACCRRFWEQITDERSRNAIDVVEQYADGIATSAQLNAVERAHNRTFGNVAHDGIFYGVEAAINVAFGESAYYVMFSNAFDSMDERFKQCLLLREIFGNPFRPITIDPRWLTSTVVDLATAIYNDKAFDRMPILGDALMDAGCDSDEIINHCQSEGPHVRGCWVVDLLLAKE